MCASHRTSKLCVSNIQMLRTSAQALNNWVLPFGFVMPHGPASKRFLRRALWVESRPFAPRPVGKSCVSPKSTHTYIELLVSNYVFLVCVVRQICCTVTASIFTDCTAQTEVGICKYRYISCHIITCHFIHHRCPQSISSDAGFPSHLVVVF